MVVEACRSWFPLSFIRGALIGRAPTMKGKDGHWLILLVAAACLQRLPADTSVCGSRDFRIHKHDLLG